MCGISGIFAISLSDHHIQIVNAIMESQVLRGPDFQAQEIIKGNHNDVILAHNRLSIIDLSKNAHQPMWDTENRCCIVFNGEIYNFIELRIELEHNGFLFNTKSDTEVILNAFLHWGVDALNRFHGPFAFAVFNKQKNQLWLCRDRFGVRPLYYVQLGNVLYFASSTTVLAKQLNLKPNLSYVAKGLRYFIYEDDSQISAYEGIYSVPASSYMCFEFNAKGVLHGRTHPYYDLSSRVQQLVETLPSNHPNDLLSVVDHKLKKAVQVRLRADVPLAISLSGGLDSSSIAALVSAQHANTMGFSFGHPSRKKSEGPIVAKCAKFLKLDMQYVCPSAHEMTHALYETLCAQDAPFTSMSIVAQYLLYKQVNRSGIKVLLGGQGGDEAFMGYKKFLIFWLQQSLRRKHYYTAIKNVLQMIPMLFAEMTHLNSYWQHRHRYMGKKLDTGTLHLPEAPVLHLNHSGSALWKRQLQDITQLSLPTLLRYEDRNAMGNSVESRLPYMDHELIELALALPEAMKIRSGYGKWIIREMMRDKIPEQIRLARFKRGFDIPISDLLTSGLGKSIRDSLQEHRSTLAQFIKKPSEINITFSDQHLLKNKRTMNEAITLLWLNKALS